MSERRAYVILLIVSTVLPWGLLVAYFLQGGTLLTLIPDAVANLVAAAVLLDALCTAVVFWYFGKREAERLGMTFHRYLVPMTLFVGLGVALALFLIQRDRHIREMTEA